MKVGAEMLMFHAAIMSAILAVGHSLPGFGISCIKTLTPPTNSRGVNRLDTRPNIPLYQLQIVAHQTTNFSTEEPMTYRVQVTAGSEHFPFTDAKISIASKSPCGTGSLTFDHNHFFDVRQSGSMCPRLLLANQKLPMNELPPLIWKPPSCGCIQFKALVASFDGEYYKDNDNVENGFLSQNVCVHNKGTREVHLKALCHVLERHSAAEILSRSSFLQRHQLEARWMDKHGLEMGLELRRSDNRLCCGKISMQDKIDCFNDSRRRRVDRFCEDGYPDIPFTSFRLADMRDREKKCCFLLGEHRYTCFAENSELKREPTVTLFDFSQDETDPVNDLAEFASSQDADIVTSIGVVQFGKEDSKEDDGNSDEKNDKEDIDDDDDENDDDGEEVVDDVKDKKPESSPSKTKKLVKTEESNTPTTPPRNVQESQEMMRTSLNEERLTSRETAPKLETQPMTSLERHKKTRKGRVPERSISVERVDSRRASSREHMDGTRRASQERPGRRLSSTEKRNRKLPGYEDIYHRGAGSSRERDILSSAERKARTRGSQQRKHDWVEIIEEPDFEDQGGRSADFQLQKLQKQMDRLRVKEQCCKTGMQVGRHVYGSILHVEKECEDSIYKFIGSASIPLLAKHCRVQFIDCCIDKAVSGPVISSSEFRERQYLHTSNVKRLGSSEGTSLLQRHSGGWEQSPGPSGGLSLLDRRAGGTHEHHEKQNPGELSPLDLGRETPEAYEFDSDTRFESMRNVGDISEDNEDDDEYNGPKRFDETDNDAAYFDLLERKDEMLNRTSPRVTEGELEDRNFVNSSESEAARGTKLGTTTHHKKHKTEHHKTLDKLDQLDRINDFTERKDTHFTDASSPKENPLLAKTPGGRSSYATNSRAGGRSRTEKFLSRETRQRETTRRSSKRTSRERRQHTKTHHRYGPSYKIIPSGKIGTQDSQEMAAAHGRKFIGALDSKEMVDAHKKAKHDHHGYVSDGLYHHQRWFF